MVPKSVPENPIRLLLSRIFSIIIFTHIIRLKKIYSHNVAITKIIHLLLYKQIDKFIGKLDFKAFYSINFDI